MKNTGCNLLIISLYADEMHKLFEMTNMGEMFYFLGVEIHQNHKRIFICQRKYANEVLSQIWYEK